MREHAAEEKFFKGIAVSGGVCRGKIIVLRKTELSLPKRQLADAEVTAEVERFHRALLDTRHQILEVQRRVRTGVGAENAAIFDAHLLVLEDPMLIDEVTKTIRTQKRNAEPVFSEFIEKYAVTLSAIEDDYLRERVADVRDVAGRILNTLLGRDASDLRSLKEPCIIIADDLVPSQTALLDRRMVLGFATDDGSRTSHTAIMARSLQIPAVVGLQTLSRELNHGDYVLLDGFNGLVILNPTDQTLFEYGQIEQKQIIWRNRLQEIQNAPAITRDGKRIILSANVETPRDTDNVKLHGAEGVGLFRTEYLFINRPTLPTEEEQYQAYRQVAAALKPAPVVIRTLDLGGDKFASHLEVPQEMNPFLGWRAIRFCLEQKDIFRAQLRAILRASVEGNVKMMYPMVSGIEELRQANALVAAYKAELRAEGIPFDDALEIGCMVEIPSAALNADMLASEVKFFSIGTNDLIQYTLAVDRLNERIAHLYQPTHPAILRLIKMTVDAAHRHNMWVGVCGEMAGDPVLVPLLLGLGVDELSATPAVVPQIKYLIRHLDMPQAEALAAEALACPTSGGEIHRRCQELVHKIVPGLFENEIK